MGKKWNKDTKLIILTHCNDNSNINWISMYFPFPLATYSKGVDVPTHGEEASTFLKFIIDNYDNLPQSIVFLHGQKDAWYHIFYYTSKIIYKSLEEPNFGEKYPYVNFNIVDYDDRILGINPAMNLLAEVWDKNFRSYFKKDCPKYVRHLCCSQFIVQRYAIEKIPLETFKKWYELSINENYDSILIARVFEYIWHMIFGLPDVVKPSQRLDLFE